jgi:uncharacterized protein (UPF0276 family)
MTIQALGPRPTLIEWDTDLPSFAVLQAEAALAQAVLNRAPARRAALHG